MWQPLSLPLPGAALGKPPLNSGLCPTFSRLSSVVLGTEARRHQTRVLGNNGAGRCCVPRQRGQGGTKETFFISLVPWFGASCQTGLRRDAPAGRSLQPPCRGGCACLRRCPLQACDLVPGGRRPGPHRERLRHPHVYRYLSGSPSKCVSLHCFLQGSPSFHFRHLLK